MLVVFGHTHAPKPFHDYIYLFHIPLFFFLSGCTSKDCIDYKSTLLKRIKGLYLPFVGFGLVFLILHNSFARLGINEHLFSLREAVQQAARVFAFSMGVDEKLLAPLWFLKALFLAEMFNLLHQRFLSRISLTFAWLIPLGAAYALLPLHATIPALRVNVIVPLFAASFFLLGRLKLKAQLRSTQLLRAALFSLPVLMLLPHWGTNDLISLSLLPPPLFLLGAFAGILTTLAASQLLSYHSWASLLLAYIGRQTLWIMCLHFLAFKPIMWLSIHYFHEASLSLYESLGSTRPLGWLACAASGVILPLCARAIFQALHTFLTSLRFR